MTLAGIVSEGARRFGDRPALVAPEGWALSYAELDRVSDAVATGLQARGIGAGDVVALLLPASPDYVVAYVAAAKAGAATAGINPRLPPAQRETVLAACDPSLVIGTADLLDAACGPVQEVDLGDDAQTCLAPLQGAQPPAPVARDDSRPLAIVFTSGTTGTPRGAVFSDRHLAAIDVLDTGGTRTDRTGPMLVSTELVHVGVMTKLRWYLRTGATLHLLRRWRAGDALRVISEQGVASIGAIAPQIALMLRQPDFEGFDLSAVQTIVAGGAPSPPALVEQARRRFGASYSIRYSSTESGGVGTGTAFDAPDSEALHTVGRPRPGVAVRVTRDDATPCATGETGTVWLRSPAVMAGYFGDSAATDEVLVDGWLRTGDLGHLGEDGCLRLAGRAGDVFIRGGYNVHPETVEAVLADHPGVSRVAIVPRAHEVLGEVGEALVVPVDPARPPTLDDLRRHGEHRLAHHELPEALRLLDDLPLTSMHKLDRRALRALGT